MQTWLDADGVRTVVSVKDQGNLTMRPMVRRDERLEGVLGKAMSTS